VFILKELKVLCFDTLLQGLTLHKNCAKCDFAASFHKVFMYCRAENKKAADKLPHSYLLSIGRNKARQVKKSFAACP